MNGKGIEVPEYFVLQTLDKHPDVADIPHRIREAIESPLEVEEQSDGRTRRWVHVPETGHYLKVIVESDGKTVHNAYRDRGYARRKGSRDR